MRLTRGEFEDMLRPAIAETVSAMRRVLDSCRVTAADVSAMVLVGGSSRIPLVSQMLSAAFGRPLALDNHPKHDVALGAAIRGTPAAQPQGTARHGQAAGSPDGRVPAAGAAGAAAGAAWVRLQVRRRVGTGRCRARHPASGVGLGRRSPRSGAAERGVRRSPVRRTRSVPPRTTPPPAWAGPGPGGPPDPPPGPSPDWRPPATVGPAPTGPAPTGPATARAPARTPSTGGSGRLRALALGSGIVVALGVMGGVLLTRGGSEPTPTPAPVPTSAPSSPSPAPATAVLPRSAQPLANDVIVWPRRVGDNWDITTISTDGTVGTQLTDSPEEDNFPVVSPDRRTIAYLHRTSPTSREVRVMGADGSGDRALFATPPPGCTDVTRPAFNGPQLRLVLPCLDAATGATTLTLVELDGTVVSVVDRGAVGDPAMAPDGLSVVYWKAAEAGQDGGEIYWASLDGSSPAGPVTAGDDRDNDPAISPTDNVAAFTRPGQGIWTVGLQAGNPVTQLTTRDGDMDPSFSPDGTQITFKRQDEVWVMDADGGNEKRVSAVGDVGTAAAWSPR